MIRVAGAALLLLFVAGDGDAQPRPPEDGRGVLPRPQIIIRISPARPAAPGNRIANVRQNIVWEESRGPRCIPIRQILGATQIGQESIDLLLRDNSRIRARLEYRCPAMDYYFGVYVRPNRDGMICEDRDEIRSRAGGSCAIERFRTLRPREP